MTETEERSEAYFDKYFKWSIAAMCEMDGDMPMVKGCHVIPKCLVSFHDLKKRQWHGAFVHFFRNDYEFDGANGIWLDTVRHLPFLERYRGVIAPDFSIYSDDRRIPQMWNTYRNRLLQCHLERLGFDVIPCVSWGRPDTFDFCFRGLPKGSVVAVSTLGVMRDKAKKNAFENGYREMCERIAPEFVVVYGSDAGLSLGKTPYRTFRNATYDWIDLLATKRKAV